MEPCDTSSPTIISTQTKVCFGHGCVTWFDDNHEKHNYMTLLLQPQAQDHHMLPRTNLGNKIYHHGQQDHIIYYDQ